MDVIDTTVETRERDVIWVEDVPERDVMGFQLREPIPSPRVPYEQLDPFLLVHDGRNRLTPDMARLPAHPHRGFDNLMYMVEGSFSVAHTTGPGGAMERARLEQGGLLHLRTGRGVRHAENPGADELQAGLEGMLIRPLLIWVNLARRDKHAAPHATVVPPEEISVRQEGDAVVRILAGIGSQVQLGTPALIFDIELSAGGNATIPIPSGFNSFAYLLNGAAAFGANRRWATAAQLGVLGQEGLLAIRDAVHGTRLLLMAGQPYHEVPRFNGPYVD